MSFRPEDFGAVGDGDLSTGSGTDDAPAFLAMLAAVYAAGGGTIRLDRRTYRLGSALFLANDGTPSTFGKQPPIRIVGCGHHASGQGGPPVAGSTLMWTAEAGTGAVGKIDTRGLGSLVLEDLNLTSRGCALPFIHTTFTTVKAERVSAWTNRGSAAPLEDFIVFGGAIGHETHPGTDLTSGDVGFQGYGSFVNVCHMLGGVRRFAWLRTYANAIVLTNNVVWNTNGNSLPDGAAIEIDGGVDSYACGNVITGNLIELTHYAYGIKTTKAAQNNFAFNGGYDAMTMTQAMIRLGPDSIQNVVVSSIGPTTLGVYLSDASPALGNVHISGQGGSEPTRFPSLRVDNGAIADRLVVNGVPSSSNLLVQPSASKSLYASWLQLKTAVADGDVTAFEVLGNGRVNVCGIGAGNIVNSLPSGASWTNNGRKWGFTGLPGSNMEINSGTGGSYLDLRNYGVRTYDHIGRLQAKFWTSPNGEGWDLGQTGDVSWYRCGPVGMKTNRKVLAQDGLGVGNSTPASTPGTVVRKFEVFDASGNSLGFLPIYDAIT